jgi:hypothetical protein
MWMLADGSIVKDGRAMETCGLYGQFSVVMFMTNMWYTTLFGMVFLVFALNSCLEHKVTLPTEQELVPVHKAGHSTDYQVYLESTAAQQANGDETGEDCMCVFPVFFDYSILVVQCQS